MRYYPFSATQPLLDEPAARKLDQLLHRRRASVLAGRFDQAHRLLSPAPSFIEGGVR